MDRYIYVQPRLHFMLNKYIIKADACRFARVDYELSDKNKCSLAYSLVHQLLKSRQNRSGHFKD